MLKGNLLFIHRVLLSVLLKMSFLTLRHLFYGLFQAVFSSTTLVAFRHLEIWVEKDWVLIKKRRSWDELASERSPSR